MVKMPRLLALLLVLAVSAAKIGVAAALNVGDASPEISFASAGSSETKLSQLKGKVIYLDFWASWCGPCRESLPWLGELQKRYGPRGLQVVSVNVDLERTDAERLMSSTGVTFPVAFDPDGKLPEKYQLSCMPSSFLIGRDLKLVKIHHGFHTGEKQEREAEIESLLKQ